MFGTFQPELAEAEYEPVRYGLTKNVDHPNAINIVFHEWKQMWKDVLQKSITPAQRLGYLFGPPGWSHNGSSLTTRQLQAGNAQPASEKQPVNIDLPTALIQG